MCVSVAEEREKIVAEKKLECEQKPNRNTIASYLHTDKEKYIYRRKT